MPTLVGSMQIAKTACEPYLLQSFTQLRCMLDELFQFIEWASFKFADAELNAANQTMLNLLNKRSNWWHG